MRTHFNLGDRPAGQVRYLGDRKLFEFEQREYQTVVGTEPRQQFICEVARDGRAFDIAACAQVAQTLIQVGRFFFRQIAETALASTLHAPQFVVTSPHRDPGEPRNERLFIPALIITQSEISLDKTLLDDLFDLLAARKKR